MNKVLLFLCIILCPLLTSCKKEIVRGTQVPKNVINVDGVGKIGQMAKFYNFSDRYLSCWGDGFDVNEDWGRWCTKENAFMIFQVRKDAEITLRLDFKAFVSDNHKENKFKITVKGIDCGEYTITKDEAIFLNLDSRYISNHNILEMKIFPLNPASPLELGINGDGRKIGFGMKSVTLWAYYPVE